MFLGGSFKNVVVWQNKRDGESLSFEAGIHCIFNRTGTCPKRNNASPEASLIVSRMKNKQKTATKKVAKIV